MQKFKNNEARPKFADSDVFEKKVVALPLSGTDLCVTLHKDTCKNIPPPAYIKHK